MREAHPLELEAIESGQAPAEPLPPLLRRRRRRFLPVAAVLALLLLAGLYRFVTFEETAIPTLPRHAAEPASGQAGGSGAESRSENVP